MNVVLWKDGITNVTSGIFHSVCRTGSWGIRVTYLLFQRGPPRNRAVFMFYDFETTQNKLHAHFVRAHAESSVRPADLPVWEDDADVDVDCRRCGKRKESFWTDPVGDLISYVFKSRPWADRFVAIAHNANAFDLLFVLNRLVRTKLLPELRIMNGQKIMCLKVENFTWLDSLNYLAMPLR